MMNIPELIREAKRGSAAAQKCLFDLFADKMMLVCRRYVKSREDAEELTLNGFYKFFKTIPDFYYGGDAGLHAWLKKIMINECLMFLRKKGAFTLVSQSAAEELSLPEEALNKLSAAEIFNLIVQLPVGYRTVFNLYAVEGFSHIEIAAVLGIAESTSRSQLSKAKAVLQKMIAQNEISHVTRKTR